MTRLQDLPRIRLTPTSFASYFMKYLIFLGVLLGLYFFGRIVGPHITPILVSEAKPSEKLNRNVRVTPSGVIIEVNLAEMRDSELPVKIKMLETTELPLVAGDGHKLIGKDEAVTLKNRNGDLLIIETIDQMAKGEVPIESTNLFNVIAESKFIAAAKEKFAAMGGGETPPVTSPVAPQPPAPKPPTKETPKIAEVTKKEPMVEPVAVTPEEPKEAPPEPEKSSRLSPEQIIEAMKKSVQSGAVKEFKFEQVKGWKASDDEEIDGVTYQIGFIIYEAQTIFGNKDVKAKALFLNGELNKWIYAKTGMQIR